MYIREFSNCLTTKYAEQLAIPLETAIRSSHSSSTDEDRIKIFQNFAQEFAELTGVSKDEERLTKLNGFVNFLIRSPLGKRLLELGLPYEKLVRKVFENLNSSSDFTKCSSVEAFKEGIESFCLSPPQEAKQSLQEFLSVVAFSGFLPEEFFPSLNRVNSGIIQGGVSNNTFVTPEHKH